MLDDLRVKTSSCQSSSFLKLLIHENKSQQQKLFAKAHCGAVAWRGPLGSFQASPGSEAWTLAQQSYRGWLPGGCSSVWTQFFLGDSSFREDPKDSLAGLCPAHSPVAPQDLSPLDLQGAEGFCFSLWLSMPAGQGLREVWTIQEIVIEWGRWFKKKLSYYENKSINTPHT